MLTQPETAPTMSSAGQAADLEILLTAEEAFPALERAFLAAKTEIWASYRVFDLSTKLRSDAGRAIGETWFDLICHVLKQGVAVHMILSDFDPILRPKLHRASWASRRAFEAAREVAGKDAKLHVVNATHSARVGLLPRLFLWPRLVREIARQARALNGMNAGDRERQLTESPGLKRWMKTDAGGTLSSVKWPPPPLVPATHHQKMAVFDRDRLCIGGMDLDERRYDDKDHQRRRDETWHDVQCMCRGPVVNAAQRHIETMLPVIAGRRAPEPEGPLLRTLSQKREFEVPFLGPKPAVTELLEAHIDVINRAERLIYLETQFFRDHRVADALASAATRTPDLGAILVLPGAPEDVAFEGNSGSDARFGEQLQAECVDKISEAFGDRLALCAPVRPLRISGSGRDTLCGSPIIYVHAKVAAADDRLAVISSANLNGRSLSWDTEAGIQLDREKDVAHLRQRVFRHWLWEDADDSYYALDTAADRWRALTKANADRAPEDREGFLVPFDPVPAQSFGRRLPGIPHAMV